MSRSHMLIFGLLAALLLAINLLPLQRSVQLNCADDTTSFTGRATVFGLPFGFYTKTHAERECPDGTEQHNHILTPASLWFDLILVGGLLAGTYYALESKGTPR